MNTSAPRIACELLVLLTLLGGCVALPVVPAGEPATVRTKDTAGKTENTQAIDGLKAMGPGLGMLIFR